MSIDFYDVDIDYTNYLRGFDHRIPYITYTGRDKFLCGVVLEVNNCNYYAPISSFKQKQFTNFPIYHKGTVVGTIRFSYMFPCPDAVLVKKDFSLETDNKYRDLLQNEWVYCNDNYINITNKANYIYKRYLSGKDTILLNHCCNFSLLEHKMKDYNVD